MLEYKNGCDEIEELIKGDKTLLPGLSAGLFELLDLGLKENFDLEAYVEDNKLHVRAISSHKQLNDKTSSE